MTPGDDKARDFGRWARKKRERALRYLYRALELKAGAMAAKAARRRRRRRPTQKPPELFNPVTELRKELMPLIGQLVELANGADPASFPMPPAPRRRRSRKA